MTWLLRLLAFAQRRKGKDAPITFAMLTIIPRSLIVIGAAWNARPFCAKHNTRGDPLARAYALRYLM
jgi:hypothetical protein